MKKVTIKQFILNREVWGHTLLWVLLFSSLNVSWTANWLYRDGAWESVAPVSAIYFFLLFYANALWLLPAYFNRENWLKYAVFLGLITVLPELIRSALVSLLHFPQQEFTEAWIRELFAKDSLLFGIISPVWVGFITSSAYYFIKSWSTGRRKIEQLEMEKVSMELNLLKSQINPHFLFNNLNALDDLIDRDTKMAKEYLQRLSRILRYTITSMENDVVPLKAEWEALDDYLFLIEERYGKAYQFEKVNHLDNMTRYLIPPASLQSLIENVVKHNRGSIDEPLKTTITLDDNAITISNLKRLKRTGVSSLGTGLKNIRERYKLLSNKEVEVTSSEVFSVSIPLITQVL
jgi:signal transduction histidine kinase